MLADPSNRQLRRVLMDALLEVNHPRAQLWLMKKDTAAFIDEHADELLGPLVDVIEPECVFVDGWLHTATLIEDAVAHPLWATVEKLNAAGHSPALTSMKSLRALSNCTISRDDLAALSSMPLERLHVRVSADDVALLPRVSALRVDLIDATPETAPHVVETCVRAGLERMAFTFFDGRLSLEIWRRDDAYDWRSNRNYDGATEVERQRLDDAHRFLSWQLRALGVTT